MYLRRQLGIVRPWIPVIAISVLLAGVGAYLLSNDQPRVYEARTTLIVGQSLSGVNPDYNQLLVSQRLSTTYASIATMRPSLAAVIAKLSLPSDPDVLSGRVAASAAPDSSLLVISAQDGDPARAAAIANALAEELIAASPAVQGRQADIQKTIDDDVLATGKEIATTATQVQALLADPNRTADQESQLENAQARLTSLRSSFASLLAFSSGSASNVLTVVQPAVAPTAPISPRPLYNAGLAAAAALLVAMAAAFVARSLNDSIRDADEVYDGLGLSALGTIAKMRGYGRRPGMYRLATIRYPHSQVAEAYRMLGANLEFAAGDTPLRSLVVTSAMPREGKTVTAANIAVAFAQAGRRVALVDANLRDPALHDIFRLPNSRGLSSLLLDNEDLDMLAQETEQENLRIVTSGPIPPNPVQLIGSRQVRALIARLQARHDIVILDSPALRGVADSALLSSFVDGTLLVVDAGHTGRRDIREAQDALTRAGAKILGVLLNRMPQRSFGRYAGYSSGQAIVEAVKPKVLSRSRGTDPSPGT